MKPRNLLCAMLSALFVQAASGAEEGVTRKLPEEPERVAAYQAAQKAIPVIEALWQTGQLCEVLGQATDQCSVEGKSVLSVDASPMLVYSIELDALRNWKKHRRNHANPAALLTEISELVFPIELESGAQLALAAVQKSGSAWALSSISGNPKVRAMVLEAVKKEEIVSSEFAYLVEIPAMYQRFAAFHPLLPTGVTDEIADPDTAKLVEDILSVTFLVSAIRDERLAEATGGKLGGELSFLPIDEAFHLLWKLAHEWEGALARSRD